MVAALVAAGLGVSVLGSGLGGIVQPGVAFVPLRDERDTLYVGWRTRDKTSLRIAFVEMLSAVAARRQTANGQRVESKSEQRMTPTSLTPAT